VAAPSYMICRSYQRRPLTTDLSLTSVQLVTDW
jgi:hypothetical protein